MKVTKNGQAFAEQCYTQPESSSEFLMQLMCPDEIMFPINNVVSKPT